ncbi:hypothetical protein [Mesorhizobium sp. Z1-4]|uniref:hypothetical protein n=1 Tax=Mesorhizobium sp. Z1-4 TaxID=2448478 RepID=UPI000FD8B82F|nr:hypothetical protein [Mesorhizobium sp. Z1-4]
MQRWMYRTACASALLFVSAASPAAEEACDIWAWTLGTDVVEVHSGPGSDFPVIAELPAPVEINGDRFAPEVTVTGSQDGWFRIEDAIVISYTSDDPDVVAFEGKGWVPGSSLGLLLNRIALYVTPSADADVVARLLNEEEGAGPDSFRVSRLHACKGDWVEVEGDLMGAESRGWATGTCSNQVTTCP